ncbi:MAG: hypothetical protein WCA23_10500, partial [Stellaceae bacterium]
MPTVQPFPAGGYRFISHQFQYSGGVAAEPGCWGRMVFMGEGGFAIGNWRHLEAWAARLKAMPGFALPYDLI